MEEQLGTSGYLALKVSQAGNYTPDLCAAVSLGDGSIKLVAYQTISADEWAQLVADKQAKFDAIDAISEEAAASAAVAEIVAKKAAALAELEALQNVTA